MLNHGQFGSTVSLATDQLVTVDGTDMACIRSLPSTTVIAADLDGAAAEIAEFGIPYTIANVVDGATPDDADDLSGEWTAVYSYDLATLYVMIDVTDQTIATTGGGGWNDDCVELFVDFDNSKNVWVGAAGWPAEDFDDNDGQLRIVPTIEGDPAAMVVSTGTRNYCDGRSITYLNDITWRAEPTTAGWRGIYALPMDAFGAFPIPNGVMGINVQIGDDDGSTRETVTSWYCDNNDAWQDPSQWGEAFLYTYTDIPQATITVDGDIADWDGITSYGLFMVAPGRTVDDDNDFAGVVAWAWDADNLYALTYCTQDDVISGEGTTNSYERDNIEAYIDLNNSKVPAAYGGWPPTYDADDGQFRFVPDNTDDLTGTDGLEGNSGLNTPSTGDMNWGPPVTRQQAEPTANSYLCEYAWAWTDYGYLGPQQIVGAECHASDNDGANREGVICWYEVSGDNSYAHTDMFGTLRLVIGATAVDDWQILDY
jgi:hypothetical protein